MSKKHLVKIQKIFSHPIPANLDIKKVLSALEYFGIKIEQTKKHTVKLFFKEEILPKAPAFFKETGMRI